MRRYFEAAAQGLRRRGQAGGQLGHGRAAAPAEREADSSIDAAPVSADACWRALIARIADGTISDNDRQAGVRRAVDRAKADVDAVIEAKGLKQINDSGAHREASSTRCSRPTPKSVDEYRAGKDKAFNALVGQAMKATKGKANRPSSTSC